MIHPAKVYSQQVISSPFGTSRHQEPGRTYQRRFSAFSIPLFLLMSVSVAADESDVKRFIAQPDHEKVQLKSKLDRGVDWLLAQQAADGGWHSETYGNMQGGVGNTALVLSALACVHEASREPRTRDFCRGVKFLTAHLSEDGLLSGTDGVPDYPVYATALLVTAVTRSADTPPARVPLSRLCDGLAKAQRNTVDGYSRDHPDFGGWGSLSNPHRGPYDEGPSNVSVTAHVLEALSVTKSLTPAARADALLFLNRCQNRDVEELEEGGFCFTFRLDDPLNKAGLFRTKSGGIRARSYRSATCDGLAGLLACDIARTDSRVVEAVSWLSRPALPTDNQVPAAEKEIAHPSFQSGLDFYTVAALMRVMERLDDPKLTELQSRVIQGLLHRQNEDGSWSNPCSAMREDDPLIATAFMVEALAKRLGTKAND